MMKKSSLVLALVGSLFSGAAFGHLHLLSSSVRITAPIDVR